MTPLPRASHSTHRLTIEPQAASALESLKMESPLKKLQLPVEADKENINALYESDEVAIPIKGIPDFEVPVKETPAVAEGIKEEEAMEPILQENAQRFVLFPIKYHEVRSYPFACWTRRELHA